MISPAQLTQLEVAAASWCGTPFCEGSPVKGAGVSCHHACVESYFESGLMPRIPMPNGPSNWRAQERSLIREWVEANGYFTTITQGHVVLEQNRQRFLPADVSLALPGDLLGFRVGALHHVGLLLSRGRLFHSVMGHTAGIAPQIPSEWARRLDAVWRLKSLA